MMQKRLIIAVILLKGFTSIIIQTLLARELLIIFLGNELTFAIILTAWLSGSALGSGLIANIFKKAKEPAEAYCFLQLALSAWVPLSLVFIRCSHAVLRVPFGEILSCAGIFAVTIIGLASVAIIDGTMFTIAFRLITQTMDEKSSAIAKIYLIESIGLIIGGFAFTFILVPIFSSFETVFFLSSANLLAGLFLLKNSSRLFKKAIFALALCACVIAFLSSSSLQALTLKIQWHKKNIVASENSVFGNITVLKENNQYTIFYDGLPAISLPAGEAFFEEDFIHIPMLLNPRAESTLFIGHAAGGLIREMLKYKKEKITYCEIDPLFIKTLLALKNKTVKNELENPRVDIQFSDGRSFIRTTTRKYDMAFVNAGLPTSLALNRYYTQEFFTQLKRCLKPQGIAVFKTQGTLSYMSEEFQIMNAVVYKTLAVTFDCLLVIPGDGFNIFIASDTKLKLDAADMMNHYRRLGIETNLINLNYLSLRLDPAYQQWFFDNLLPAWPETIVNRDLKPTGLYAALRLYYAQFSKQIPVLFKSLQKIKFYHFILIIFAFFIFLRWLTRHGKNAYAALDITALTSGMFAMAAQTIILFLFQSLLGILFQWLAILTASFMAGIAAGTLLTNSNKSKSFASLKTLSLAECLLPPGITLLMLLTVSVFNKIYDPQTLKWSFSFLSFLAGGLIGLEIPVVFSLLLQYASKNKPSYISAGRLYCLDLTGACIGAFLAPLILIPNCGIIPTMMLMCLLKIVNGLNLFLLKTKNTQENIESAS